MNHRSQASSQPGVAALERGLTLLSAFDGGENTLSLAQLAIVTGFYKSTILRLATSLVRMGYLQRIEDGRYRLGSAVFRLGRRYQQSFQLANLVVPALRHLVERTGESASFYVRDGDWDTCLYRIESPLPIREAGVSEGDSFPIDESASSRVLSAFLDAPGRRYDALRRQVVTVTQRSKRIAGAAAVICPVFGVDQQLTGTLVLSGPESRFRKPAVSSMRKLIVAQAAALTTALGGDGRFFDKVKATPAAAQLQEID